MQEQVLGMEVAMHAHHRLRAGGREQLVSQLVPGGVAAVMRHVEQLAETPLRKQRQFGGQAGVVIGRQVAGRQLMQLLEQPDGFAIVVVGVLGAGQGGHQRGVAEVFQLQKAECLVEGEDLGKRQAGVAPLAGDGDEAVAVFLLGRGVHQDARRHGRVEFLEVQAEIAAEAGVVSHGAHAHGLWREVVAGGGPGVQRLAAGVGCHGAWAPVGVCAGPAVS